MTSRGPGRWCGRWPVSRPAITSATPAAVSGPISTGSWPPTTSFYVSPFYPVDGRYRMSLPEPGDRLALTVVLDRPGGHSFSATVHGRRRRMADRPGYADYMARTSGFLPLPPRHGSGVSGVRG
jgi:Protein of unknown function (DUF1365)